MRIAFVNTLIKNARKNKKIILLTGDLGYSVFEEFKSIFPDRYINAGVAEQNMAGVAAGLAMEGFLPVIYSIIPFTTMRNFEQIRNDICYQNLNVKIVGVGAGFSYGPYGHTHHALEDIALMRSLANMTVLAPGDPFEAELCTDEMFLQNGPVYLRIGKKGEPRLYDKKPSFRIGKMVTVKKGTDVCLISCSTLLETTVHVSEMLSQKGISAHVVSSPSIKPLDTHMVVKLAGSFKHIVTIEEHSLVGGLGSAVAECVVDHHLPVLLHRFGVPDRFTKVSGNQQYMRAANGLSPEQLTNSIVQLLNHE